MQKDENNAKALKKNSIKYYNLALADAISTQLDSVALERGIPPTTLIRSLVVIGLRAEAKNFQAKLEA